MQTSAPNPSQKSFILISSVAIIFLSKELSFSANCQVFSIKLIFFPLKSSKSASGLPGNLDESYLAGITNKLLIILTYFVLLRKTK